MNRIFARAATFLTFLTFWTLLAVPAFGQSDAGPAVAAGGVAGGLSPQAERARIQAERASVEVIFLQAQAACYRKFAVADCQSDARLIRREALADLRRQEASLNAALARQKGAGQLSRIDSRSSTEAELESASRRAQALEKHQARQASADEKASSRAAAAQEADSPATDGSLRDEKKGQTKDNQSKDNQTKNSQTESDRAAKARAAALEQQKYELKQKQGREKEAQRQRRLSGQPESSGKAPPKE